ENHGQRIGFLTRRAPRHPGPDDRAAGARAEELRQDVGAQEIPGSRIAEEAGDANQKLPEEEIDLARVVAQVANVVADLVDLVQAHAARDAPVDGALLVEGEVVARLRAQKDENLLESALSLLLERLFARLGDVRRVLAVADDPRRQLLRGSDHVGQAGI